MTTGLVMAAVGLWLSGSATVLACIGAERHEQREMKA